MKRIALLSIFVLLACVSSAGADGFNCWMPPFGESLETLNANHEFTKKGESKGVAYYTYAGECDMKLSRHTSPQLTYGFVNGRLYCRLLSFHVPEGIGNVSMKTLLDEGNISMKTLKMKDGTDPDITSKEYVDGDWTVIQLVNKAENRVVKIKFNEKTDMIKSGVYHIPLREELDAQ